MIFMTGVGFRHLLAAVEKHVARQRFLHALADITTICRGPKPVAAMAEVGLKPTHRVPEPNTWRELLATIDGGVPIANHTVGLQEYGITNRSLIAGLEARGAKVVNVRVYQWELPEDTQPLEENIRAIVAGERDVLIVTSAHQVANLLRMAQQLGLEQPLREALERDGRSPPSARRRARCSASTNCRSISSRSIPRWARWSPPPPSKPARFCSEKRQATRVRAASSLQPNPLDTDGRRGTTAHS